MILSCNEFEKISSDQRYEVENMLSFICNPAAIDLETNIQEKQDELVFDFPLTCVIPGVLDKRIIKSSANPSCRKLMWFLFRFGFRV